MRPLTIEELRVLNVGDWVWVVNLLTNGGSYVQKDTNSQERFNQLSWNLPYLDYGTTWLAYKNKEQAENDKMKYEKFETAEELLKGYKELEKAFTKKCQEYNKMVDEIKNGTLVQLPCKVGDIVYRLHHPTKEIRKWEVTKVLIKVNGIAFELGRKGTDDYAFFYDYELYENYFFIDKSAAEARLKELKGESQ